MPTRILIIAVGAVVRSLSVHLQAVPVVVNIAAQRWRLSYTCRRIHMIIAILSGGLLIKLLRTGISPSQLHGISGL